MASNSAQYIFGEFSPDEFNQFFVTPRCTVELPPYNETNSCGSQPSGDLSDGEDDYQRIEFGVTEFINTEVSLLNNTDYSISSTLNPQAPEFILGCTPTQKNDDDDDDDDDLLDENNYESIDCQFTEPALSLDSSSNPDNDGVGSLGQRERKKKKKRPPGYYNYLEAASDVGAPPTETLVNGHVDLSGLNSISTEDLQFTGDIRASSASPRTCNSPENSVDLNEALSDDASVSSALDNTRTAGQPDLDSVINSELCYMPTESAADCPERTAVQHYASMDTTENHGVTNGQTLDYPEEDTTSNGVELHTEENACLEQHKQEDLSTAAEAVPTVSVSAPVNQPAKSWASLFHNSKSSSSAPVAYVENRCAPPTATSSLVPDKHVEVKEGPVPVSEDSVAITIAGIVYSNKSKMKNVSQHLPWSKV